MSTKPLVAVMSCYANLHRIQEIRNTWLKDAQGIDVRFFLGRSPDAAVSILPQPDEIVLDVADDYTSLPLKVRASLSWAMTNSYTNVFKTDDDTLVIPQRLLTSNYQAHDYTGRLNSGVGCEYYNPTHGWASGGPGYWLSTRAMTAVTSATWNGDWAEDRWVGNTLNAAGITCHHDTQYTLYPFFADDRRTFSTACNIMQNLINESIVTTSKATVTLTTMYTAFKSTGSLPEVVTRQQISRRVR